MNKCVYIYPNCGGSAWPVVVERQGSGYWILASRYQIPNSRCLIPDSRFGIGKGSALPAEHTRPLPLFCALGVGWWGAGGGTYTILSELYFYIFMYFPRRDSLPRPQIECIHYFPMFLSLASRTLSAPKRCSKEY